jgi:hypothetical protein
MYSSSHADDKDAPPWLNLALIVLANIQLEKYCHVANLRAGMCNRYS